MTEEQLQEELNETITLDKRTLLNIASTIVCAYNDIEFNDVILTKVRSTVYELLNNVLDEFDKVNSEDISTDYKC